MRSTPRARSATVAPAHARLIAAVLVLGAALLGGWVWLRDSCLVRVRDVEVTGVTSSQAVQVRAALERAGRRMTTLDVREDVLRAAVAPFASIGGLQAHADLPHRLLVQVTERRPVAAVSLGDRRVPVTATGLLLRGVQAGEHLPDLRTAAGAGSRRLAEPRARAGLTVAAAAPRALLRRASRVWWGPRGLTLDLARGPALVFGSAGEARPKWAAAARVLAEPSAAGATYLDLRVPGRVGAGGLGPIVAEDPDGHAIAPPAPPSTSP